LQASVVCEAFS